MDAGVNLPVDAGPDASVDAGAQPIVAPDDQWTWVDFADSRCASGSPTGLAVNPHAGASDLLIYLEGGGECYDATGCWGATPKANNLRGYDAATFAAAPQLKYPALNRDTDAGSPFQTANLVYIPYCTGDLHGGNTVTNLDLPDGGVQPTYFYGAYDLDVFLPRLVATFASASRVWLLGTSAGGFGTILEFDRISQAFGGNVDIIDDSGPPLVANGGTSNAGLFRAWNYTPPAGCASCSSFADVLRYDLQVQGGWATPGRFAFLSFTEDTVISADFGYSLSAYPGVMMSFSSSLPAGPAAATFLVSNEQSHVVESDPRLAAQYLPWLTQLANRDPAWADQLDAAP
jgi:hypothetical protein